MKVRKRMSFSAIVAILLVALFLRPATAEEDVSLVNALLEAFQKSQGASYIAEVSQPAFPEFPKVTRAVFYRKVEAEGSILLRTELYQGKKQQWVFLKNPTGEYAIHIPSGKTARGGNFLRLLYLEQMFNQLALSELERCDFQKEGSEYQGRPAQLLRIEAQKRGGTAGTSQEEEAIVVPIGLSGWSSREKIKEIYPFVREYTIDDATGVILAVRKFNWHGKLLSRVSLGKFDFSPNWGKYPNVFVVPETIDYIVPTTAHFVTLLKNPPRRKGQAPEPKSRRGNLPKERHYGNALRYGLLVLGIFFLGVTIWLRRKE